MANSYTLCLFVLVAVQAASCMPQAPMNPLVSKRLMERSFSSPLSIEDIISRDSDDSFEVSPFWLGSSDDISSEEVASLSPHSRVRRQSPAMDLSLSHHDSNGNPRPVGRPYGFADANVVGNNRDNYHANMGAGLGVVGWRSPNGRHSVGVGATVDHFRGRFDGHRYSSRPSYGVGIGYRGRFG